MDYLPMPDTARQAIDRATVFTAHRRVQAEARRLAGGMYWKRQGSCGYLVKTGLDNRQGRAPAMMSIRGKSCQLIVVARFTSAAIKSCKGATCTSSAMRHDVVPGYTTQRLRG